MTTLSELKAKTQRAPANLTAQNATVELNVAGLVSQVASVITSSTVASNADFVIEAEFLTNEWTPLGLFDARSQDAADSVTGPSQYGWTDIPGATRVRVRRTDAHGGNGTMILTTVEA